MSRRRAMVKGLLAFLAVAALVLISSVAWKHSELNWASKRIGQEYSAQISLLSEYLVARPDWKAQEENWEEEQKAVERLRQAFTDEAFCYVSVSLDGHHGLTSVKRWPSRGPNYVLTRGILCAQGAKPEHKVYMGWSTKGERFYVYEARVPEAKHMRCFEFWIRRSSVREGDR